MLKSFGTISTADATRKRWYSLVASTSVKKFVGSCVPRDIGTPECHRNAQRLMAKVEAAEAAQKRSL
jgi:hypothetical protein